jgi:Holliday junction resolvase RusA-like endonuclease
MSRVEHLAEGVTLYLGDCREILPTLGKVDAVVTDPPYGVNVGIDRHRLPPHIRSAETARHVHRAAKASRAIGLGRDVVPAVQATGADMSFLVTLTVPPAANNLFATSRDGRRRFKSKRYTAWIETAGKEILSQGPKPISGPYKAFISLPKIRGDADGRIKPLLDLLVKHQLTPDDRHCKHVSVTVIPDLEPGYAVVAVEKAA